MRDPNAKTLMNTALIQEMKARRATAAAVATKQPAPPAPSPPASAKKSTP